ncbi:class I SAM-dependent methyltransferase [Marinomonas mediterranea]|jgi:16S rRNA m(2)G 1207 methyltransferase (EC 2.1.1.52)|uniref:Ribosomal RNA small subunit methyltransferase C n=1 Tax=Marinomonas mediterranea (strain ATCC 700492 / JCM 21426 / NBRC 103028 / MMB-1) TaxID=717774 RepID=F2JW91_MARM1|nr:class I SAM-dependent methyltransferase [Marinomonas mediterranea]ADZ89479.1 Ribosomal RNA small subunit methyltransferase C [Marinomonas mediterranea MMB-1]WCN15729.1 methyltransferase [Marinomonas mediterranea MMB-1]
MNFNPPSQLLERSLDQFQGKVLVANPEDDFPLLLSRQSDVSAWCQSHAVFERLSGLGMDDTALQFSAYWESNDAAEQFDHVVVYQPKAKEFLTYLLACVLPALKTGGFLWLVGDNKSGVKSSVKKLEAPLSSVGKFDGAKHCLLYQAQKTEAAQDFVFSDWITRWEQDIAGQTFTLCSIPGVFGHGKLDKGTALLLEQLEKHRFMSGVNQARILDFGCGDGVISMWLHKRTGANVTSLDDSALALKATELTFAENDATDSLTTIASNGLKHVKGRFNYVVTNPPFHTGINTDYSIAERFFIGVKQHLTLNGELFVVANDFLRYSPLLDAALGGHTRLERDRGFAVYHARQPKK